MDTDIPQKKLLIGVVCLSLLAIFATACSSSGSTATSNGSSTTAAATPTCPPNRFKTATGTIQSITGTSLLVKNTQGSNVQASYTTTTRFQQQTAATTTALKDGAFVVVAVTADANNNYIATSVTLSTSRAGGFGGGQRGGTGGFGGGPGANGGTPGANSGGPGGSNGQPRNASCFRQGGGFGPGANGGTNGTASGRAVTGTIAQLSGNTLTITDFQGSSYTVALNTATKIVQFKSATASALKSGANLTITGSDNGKGGIAAQSITILLPTNTNASAA